MFSCWSPYMSYQNCVDTHSQSVQEDDFKLFIITQIHGFQHIFMIIMWSSDMISFLGVWIYFVFDITYLSGLTDIITFI